MTNNVSATTGADKIGGLRSPAETAALIAKLQFLREDPYGGVVPSPQSRSWSEFGYDAGVVGELRSLFGGESKVALRQRLFVDRDRRHELLEFRLDARSDLLWLGQWWAKSFTLWEMLTPSYVVQAVLKFLNAAEWSDDNELMKALGSFGDRVAKYADFLDWNREGDWQFCCHLKLFGGYQATAASDEMLEDVVAWVNTPRTHEALFGDYHVLFHEHLFGWFAPTRASSFAMTFAEYLRSRAVWARSGSSTTKADAGLAKTKWNLAWTKSDAQLRAVMARVGSSTDVVHTLIQKLELGKVRGVIGVDDAMYLAMDYLSQFVEDDLSHTPMFNFMSDAKQASSWAMLGSHGTKVPLDESGFDHDKEDVEVLSCVDAIGRFARSRASATLYADIAGCLQFVKRHIFGGFISVGGVKVPVKKGVLSGWRWTYLVDTMINVTQIELCLAELRRAGTPVYLQFVCSGDDVGCVFGSFREAGTFYVAYASYGYQINAAKFWVSAKRNEFLRVTVWDGWVRGYANRMLPKLLFTNPLQTSTTREEKISSLVAVWSKVFVRGWPKRDVLELLYRDVSGAMHISISSAKRYVHTPTAYGGGGAWPYVGEDGLGAHFRRGDDESRIKLSNLAGAMDYVSHLSAKYGERELFEEGVMEVVEGTLAFKKPPKKQSIVMTDVFVPEPISMGRNFAPARYVSFLPRELLPFSSTIVRQMLDGDRIYSFVNEQLWRSELAQTSTWTAAAQRMWLNAKLPATAVFFTGRDSVRIAVATEMARSQLSHMKRVSVEIMRRVCFSASTWVATRDLVNLNLSE